CRHLRVDLLCHPGQHLRLLPHRKAGAMAEAGRMTNAETTSGLRILRSVTALRLAIIAIVLSAWEALAASGLLYRDVVPSLIAIGAALFELLTVPDMPARIDLDLLGSRVDLSLVLPPVS